MDGKSDGRLIYVEQSVMGMQSIEIRREIMRTSSCCHTVMNVLLDRFGAFIEWFVCDRLSSFVEHVVERY